MSTTILRRRSAMFAAMLALLLLVTACSGTTREDDTADAPEEDSAATTEEEADAPTEDEATDEPAATENTPEAAATTEDAGDDTADGATAIEEGIEIAFLPKQINNPYFTTADGGGEEAVGEFAGSYSEVGPSEASASSQVSYINTLTQQGVGAIAISANDPNAVCPALNEARDAGIAVVTYDSDTDPSCRDLFINQASAEGIARVQVEMVAEQIGGAGEIAVLSATPNATNQNAWIELMEGILADEYPDIELVTVAYGNDDDQDSFTETQALLQSYPDLAGIVSPTTVGISAAARYLSGSEFKGEVALTGLGTPNQMREFVEDGTVTAFALWNPADLGYLAAYAGGALASGLITGAEGDTFEAGKLGSYTVEADGSVLLGPPTVFDIDNIGDFDF
ncbi:putative L-rhamnose ABC transporter, substrate-binding component [Euzebya pacifica]|uniref:Putative L-rhamnose ABC transporter, substrate-binding component n=1 Tax=Euzebya pacifica TaxID=1608957 RepID=A0A346Y000_9ACTN|nr:rhamnose ABC transporter substrate-binding protein [Euzebya pacifica]AXV07797.1 putative L-rhamnose ABC transporter, substrate-binding component [Euzebya pacifica]